MTTATPVTMKQLRTGAATSHLSPQQVYELDVARAARLGIDISHLRPDERCKYPSKFCCHKRARKSTGKLHRFCEDHRARAKVNQKRWTDVRRRQEQSQELVANCLAARADTAVWLDHTKPLLAPARNKVLVPLAITAPRDDGVDCFGKLEPSSPTSVDALLEDEIPLSEDDIDMLTTIVAQCEKSSEAMTMEDAWLMSMLQEVDTTAEPCADYIVDCDR